MADVHHTGSAPDNQGTAKIEAKIRHPGAAKQGRRPVHRVAFGNPAQIDGLAGAGQKGFPLSRRPVHKQSFVVHESRRPCQVSLLRDVSRAESLAPKGRQGACRYGKSAAAPPGTLPRRFQQDCQIVRHRYRFPASRLIQPYHLAVGAEQGGPAVQSADPFPDPVQQDIVRCRRHAAHRAQCVE